MKALNPGELNQWIASNKNFYILDVREKWEYELVSIPNAVLSPLGTLQSKPPAIDKNKTVVVYCHTGRRSMMGCTILESLGFTDLFNLTGGIDLYADQVDPAMEKY